MLIKRDFIIIIFLYVFLLSISSGGLIFTEDAYGKVSPLPEVVAEADVLQNRSFIERNDADTGQKKSANAAQQKELKPSKGKPTLIAGKPTKIYYQLAVNDKIFISVWRVPELSLEFIVGPDGKISFPLIGDIDAAGKTLTELSKEITEKLKEYVNDPQVSVMVREFAGDKVIVFGEVKNPGVYKFVGATNIMSIIAQAGGFTDRARSASIVIVREPTDPSQKDQNLLVVNIKSILKGKIRSNIEINPNDIIYVSRTFVSNVKEFYDNWISPQLRTLVDYESYINIRKTNRNKQ